MVSLPLSGASTGAVCLQARGVYRRTGALPGCLQMRTGRGEGCWEVRRAARRWHCLWHCNSKAEVVATFRKVAAAVSALAVHVRLSLRFPGPARIARRVAAAGARGGV